MRRLLAGFVDLLIGVDALVILFVLLTGGGVYHLGETVRVSLRSIDNPLTALAILLLLRHAIRSWGPLWGVRQWTGDAALARSARGIQRAQDWASTVPPSRASRIVLAAVVGAAALKAWLAYANPGFFSGDDVEIHEMTLGALLDEPWPVWDLRNALFPMGLIYPAQWAALNLGVRDVGALVVVGRLAVAAVSSLAIWLTWRAAREWSLREPGYAVLAALLVATTKLQIAFGSTELPRPVATVLMLLAFVILQRNGAGTAAAAGVVLGCAAALRFSEAVFLVPAVVQLLIERRTRDAAIVGVGTGATAAVLLAVSDRWYWGDAFHSVRAIVDYTLVQRLSSRGYEPAWWYLTAIPQWTNPAVFVLAVLGWREAPKARWWAALPLILLSLLPHKEARYLVPITPFVCLLAAGGLKALLRQVHERGAPAWVPAAVIGGLAWGLVHDVGHYRLRRSNEDVILARRVFAGSPRPRAIVAEQAWRLGGHLYAGGIPLTDLDPALLADPEYLRERLTPGALVLIDRDSLAREAVRTTLESRGFREARTPAESEYVLWRSADVQ